MGAGTLGPRTDTVCYQRNGRLICHLNLRKPAIYNAICCNPMIEGPGGAVNGTTVGGCRCNY